MSEGFSGSDVGYGSVATDARKGMKVDRKNFPRGVAIADVAIDHIEEKNHGSATGRWHWPYGHKMWNIWREVMPAVALDDAPQAEDNGPVGAGPAWRPIWGKQRVVDTDLLKRPAAAVEQVGVPMLAEIPAGWPGLVVRGSDHVDERPQFFGAGGPCVADHGRYAPKYSSLRYTVTGKTIDHVLAAAESTWSFVKDVTGVRTKCVQFDAPAIALNLTSGPGGAGYGLFADTQFGTALVKPPKSPWRESPHEDADNRNPGGPAKSGEEDGWYPVNLLGVLSHTGGGGINAGKFGDQHEHGRTKYGEPLNAGHFSIYSLRNIPGRSPEYDAPAEHGLEPYVPAGRGLYPFQVLMLCDAQSQHEFCGEKRQGLWRREVFIPLAPPTWVPTGGPPRRPPPRTPEQTQVPPPGNPGNPPGIPGLPGGGNGGGNGGGGNGGDVNDPSGMGDPIGLGPSAGIPIRTPAPAQPRNPLTPAPQFDPLTAARIAAYFGRAAAGGLPGPLSATIYGLGTPAMTIFADPKPGREIFAPGEQDERDAWFGALRPAVLRISGFGKVGTSRGGYTETSPAGMTYLAHGTGPGGALVSPPEWSQWRLGSYNKSSAYWGFHPTMAVGFGTPSNGVLVDGPQWSLLGSSGAYNLQLKLYDASGAERTNATYTIKASVKPSGTQDLGALSAPWANGYFQKLYVSGLIDPTGVVFDEQASTPWTPAAAKGCIWVKNDTPNTLWFTDDAGTDHQIAFV